MLRFIDGDRLTALQAALAGSRDELDLHATRLRSLAAGPAGPDARLRAIAGWCDDACRDLVWRWQHLTAPPPPPPRPAPIATSVLTLLRVVRAVDWRRVLEAGAAWRGAWGERVLGAHHRSGLVAARFILAGLRAPSPRDAHDPFLIADPAFVRRRNAARHVVSTDWAAVDRMVLSFDEGPSWVISRYDHVAEYETEVGARLDAAAVAEILDRLPPRERAIALGTLVDWALHDLDPRDLTDEERDLLRDALAPVRAALATAHLPPSGAAPRSADEATWREAARAASARMYVRRETTPAEALAWTFAGVVGGASTEVAPEEGNGARTALLIGQAVGGFIPLSDVRDAVSQARRGELVGAGLAALSALPLVGDAARVGDRLGRGLRVTGEVAGVLSDARTAGTHVRSRRVPAVPSGDLEGHPARLQPGAQDGTEGRRRRQDARAVR